MENDDLENISKAFQDNPDDLVIKLGKLKKYLALQEDLEEYLLETGLLKKGQTLTSAILDKTLNIAASFDSPDKSLEFTLGKKRLKFILKWSSPFTPEVEIVEVEGELVGFISRKSRCTISDNLRQKDFEEKCFVKSGKRSHNCSRRYPQGQLRKVIVSEGDSWFQYPVLLTDIIDHIMSAGHVVHSLGAAGDTLEGMFEDQQYMSPIKEYNTDIFLFSGGGNDLLGNIGQFIDDTTKKIDEKVVDRVLEDKIGIYYNKIFTSLIEVSEDLGVDTICHGYDYIIPLKGSKSIGSQLAARGIAANSWKGITDALINKFNEKLLSIAKGYNRVHYVNLRNKVGDGNWYDEIHPNSDGSKKTASCIMEKIKELRGN